MRVPVARITSAALMMLLLLIPLPAPCDGGGAVASAATVSVAASQDTTLYQDPTGSFANGAGERMFVGVNTDLNVRRGLIQFNIASAVPAFSYVTSSTLTLNCSKTNSTEAAVSVELHRVTASWGEGASNAGDPGGSGALALPGDATWLHRFYNTTFWTTPGGDFRAEPSGETTVSSVGVYSWPSSDGMVADVQDWLDHPANNFGWALIGSSGESVGGSAKRFDTRENTDIRVQPSLAIDFFLAGDANFDDRVDTLDFNSLAANFGRHDSGVDFSHADFNRDGTVDTLDFNLMAANFGKQFPPDGGGGLSVVVPEPTGAVLLFASILWMLRRK
jgi:hypothetical protein